VSTGIIEIAKRKNIPYAGWSHQKTRPDLYELVIIMNRIVWHVLNVSGKDCRAAAMKTYKRCYSYKLGFFEIVCHI